MKIIQSKFEGLFILEAIAFRDERGHFTEAYNYEVLRKGGIDIQFVQDNQSFSRAGVIRGLHFQNSPKAQSKLVRVLQGAILDVAVDLRRDKPTFRGVHAIELTRDNARQVLIPKGFAHGFSVLSEFAEILYKCDDTYSKDHEGGINIDDAELKIDWKTPLTKRIVSTKDKSLPTLENAKFNF